jgi:hypothetical protein
MGDCQLHDTLHLPASTYRRAVKYPHQANTGYAIPQPKPPIYNPGSKPNLVYHIPRCLPRHGEGNVGRRTPPWAVDQAPEVVSSKTRRILVTSTQTKDEISHENHPQSPCTHKLTNQPATAL